MAGNRVYLADKPTLDKVDTTTANTNGKVGTTGDVGGSTSAGSIFGKLNALLAYLLGNVTESLASIWGQGKRLNDLFTDVRVAKIDAIDTNAASAATKATAAAGDAAQAKTNTAVNNTASATGTLSQKLSKVIGDVAALNTALGAKRAVKSVQRGVISAGGTVNDTMTIPISAVNPAKCSVRLESRVQASINGAFAPLLISLTETALTVKKPLAANTVDVGGIWEIIEFY